MTAAVRLHTHGEETEFAFTQSDFRFIADLVKDHTGIVLADNKFKMVYARLARRVRALGMDDFKAYCALLDSPKGEHEFQDFVNAMTTNLTKFFRENHHFEHVKEHVIGPARQHHKRLRIWSAGCSTGEEPYSLAISLLEKVPDPKNWDAKILATDLDTNCLLTGANGIYNVEGIKDMPPLMRERYFLNHADQVKAKECLRQLISFKPLNLLQKWPMSGPFDAIFCRNVMIYFDNPTKSELVRRFGAYLKVGGYLYIGHSETLLDQQHLFKLVGRTIYKKLGG